MGKIGFIISSFSCHGTAKPFRFRHVGIACGITLAVLVARAALPAVPYIRLLSPGPGTSWEAGTQQNIVWTSTPGIRYSGGNYVALTLIVFNPAGSYTRIACVESAQDSGSYRWTVPDIDTRRAVVKATWKNTCAANVKVVVYAETQSPEFTIVRKKQVKQHITFDSPSPGMIWTAGTQQIIRWTRYSDLPTPPGATYLSYVITSSETKTSRSYFIACLPNVPAHGLYLWTVPNEDTTHARVAVGWQESCEPGAVKHSGWLSPEFTIRPRPTTGIVLTSPTAGSSWRIGTTQIISWRTEGEPGGLVHLSFRTGPDDPWHSIGCVDTAARTSYSYTWTVPGPGTAHARILAKRVDKCYPPQTVFASQESADFTIAR
jgi:hypothetical protein